MFAGGLTLATLVGTFGGNKGGMSPIYKNKVGTWGGINIGGYTEHNPGSKFYGISLNLVSNNDNSEFYGIDGSLFATRNNENEVYGVQGVWIGATSNNNSEINGLQATVMGVNVEESSSTVNGIQAGLLYNECSDLNGFQLGAVNYKKENERGNNMILNW